jgi:hypothetical protein
MSFYPDIRRCQHIKVNGTQCGSPALTRHKFCFFHQRWREASIKLSAGRPRSTPNFQLPVLEDANSIQVALMQVVGMILSGELEAKRAGLLLYALQTASANLRAANFEPEVHAVVVHPEWVKDTPLGEDQFQEAADYVEEEVEEEDAEELEEGAEEEPAADELEAEEAALETQEAKAQTEAAAADTHTDADEEAAAEPETSPVPTLAEARAEMKKQVMAAYPEIMASLKNVKACAASPAHRRNGNSKRLQNSA